MQPVKKNIFPFILFTLMIVPNIIYVMSGTDFNAVPFFARLLFFLLCVALILLPITVMSLKKYFLLGILFFLLSPPEIMHLLTFKASISTGAINAAFQSDARETSELVSAYMLIVLLLATVFCIYIWILVKKIRSEYLPLFWRKFIAASAALLITGLYAYGVATDIKIFPYHSLAENFKEGWVSFKLKLDKVYPYCLMGKIYDVQAYHKQLSEYHINTRTQKQNAQQHNGKNEKQIFVLVIGETCRSDHWSVNGYKRKTSPYTDTATNFISLGNTTSCSNLTSLSIPFILTGTTPEDFGKLSVTSSFQKAFKEAGFYTAWLSNQNIVNLSAGSMGVPQIKDADTLIALNNSFEYTNGFDEKLLPEMEKILKSKHKKLFIVLHIMGSHFRYNYRYPAAFDKFKPSFNAGFTYNSMNEKNLKQIINTYDNSILYTDYFLYKVKEKIRNSSVQSFIMYVADHGENFCDDNRQLFYHGTPYCTPNELDVPLFLWYSDSYKKANEYKVENMRNNAIKKVTTTSVYHTLLGLADISARNKDSTLDISSLAYKEPDQIYILSPDLDVVKYHK